MATLAERARRLNRRRSGGFALLTDRERLPDPMPLLARLKPGDRVVLRHYDAPGRAALARILARACRARRIEFMVAGDLDLAVALGAGMHLPEWQARRAGAGTRLWHRRTGRTFSVAAHSRAALVRGARLGADAALLGPAFPTASHPGGKALGAIQFRLLARTARLPVWALGGVTARTLPMLEGAVGVATVGGLGSGKDRVAG